MTSIKPPPLLAFSPFLWNFVTLGTSYDCPMRKSASISLACLALVLALVLIATLRSPQKQERRPSEELSSPTTAQTFTKVPPQRPLGRFRPRTPSSPKDPRSQVSNAHLPKIRASESLSKFSHDGHHSRFQAERVYQETPSARREPGHKGTTRRRD